MSSGKWGNMAPGGEVSGEGLSGHLEELLGKIAAQEGFTSYRLDVSLASGKGDNYVGVVYRVKVVGRRGDQDGRTTSLILKCMPENPKRRTGIDVGELFETEVTMYREVVPVFDELQEEKGFSLEERFSSLARCLGCDVSPEGAISLVLEDMAESGYVMGDRRKGLDAAHCSLVLRELAKIHAFSYALRDQQPLRFRQLRSLLKERMFKPNKDGSSIGRFQAYVDQIKNIVLQNFSPESKYTQRFEEFSSHFNDRMQEAVNGESAEPYTVICHGDCWTNNLLFRYSEDGKSPEAICLLDLQLARYSSPVTDISYFLYCCTEEELRRQSYQSLMDEYYSTLCHFLENLGSEPERLFPRSAFEEHQKKFSQFGLGMATLALLLFTARSEDTPDMDSDKGTEDSFTLIKNSGSNPLFMKRIKDVIVDMVDRNFI